MDRPQHALPEVNNAAAVTTTLSLLTVGLRNAAGAELCAIEDKEEAEGEEVEITVREEGIAIAEEASSDPVQAIPSCFICNERQPRRLFPDAPALNLHLPNER